MINVSDDEIIEASMNTQSAAEAARTLGINYKTYKVHAERLGVFNTNQALKGVGKKRKRLHIVDDTAFENIGITEAYWLGFLAADGSIVDNSIKIMINSRDEDILYKFLKFLKSDYTVGRCKSHYEDAEGVHYFDASYIKVISEDIVRRLSHYGIVQGKKYKDIDFMKNIPDKFKVPFIVGFFDGDGSISYVRNEVVITIACNKILSKSIIDILVKYSVDYNIGYRDTIDIIYIKGSNCTQFIKLYTEVRKYTNTLDRKYVKMVECI